jgi:hypothetical protein
MHQSLRPATNLLMIVVTAGVVIVALLLSDPSKGLPLIGLGGLFGTLIGALQLRAMSAKEELFLAADSALAVRRALMASKSGRAAVYTLWGAAVLLATLAIGRKNGSPMDIVAGYAALVLLRELVSLKGCFALQRSAERRTND